MSFDYRGRRAVVTGASSGIGEAFARALAARGAIPVLVARRRERLERLAGELERASRVAATVVEADLATEAGLARAIAAARGTDILINNAGFATHGRFEAIEAARERDEIALNCLAPVRLAKACLPEMLARGTGAIVNVASTAGFQPTPNMAVYGATKAFMLSFSEALAEECRTRGVRVVALCPGPTRTEFFDVAGSRELRESYLLRLGMTPERVVDAALAALERGRSVAIPGLVNNAGAASVRLLPRSLIARVSGWVVGGGRR